jgi:photosystem II stability/assembly factor-like uncharacterized protein
MACHSCRTLTHNSLVKFFVITSQLLAYALQLPSASIEEVRMMIKARSRPCMRSCYGRVSMTQKLWLALRAVLFAASALLQASSPSAACAQVIEAPSPDCYASLSKAKLVAPDAGWAIVNQPVPHVPEGASNREDCVSEHLYWTDNDGQTWREITPHRMPTKNLGIVYFLDRTHGWTISSDADGEGSKEPFYVLFTGDSGKHWQTFPIQRAAVRSVTDMYPTAIFFADAQHGWIPWHWAMMNSRLSALTATSDGGRSWRTLPEPLGPGPMHFTSARDGWMVGGTADQVGIPIAEANQLWATHDGGEHWSAIAVPVPPDLPEELRFRALKIDSAGSGVVAGEVSLTPQSTRFFTFVTQDGGKSWQSSHFDEEATQADPSLTGTRVAWSVFRWPMRPTTIRTGDTEISPAVPDTLSLQGRLGDVDFIDDSHAWARFTNGRTGPFTAQLLFELLSTTDGGKKFRTITPPAATHYPMPPPELFTLDGSVVRFPPPSAFALRRPPIATLGKGGLLRFRPAAGGPMIITGAGFRRENTVWLGSRAIPVASNDGENLKFLLPPDVAPGTYKVYVENGEGKTNETEVSIRAAQALRISNVQNGEAIHPGQEIIVSGSGFLLDNTVWFGAQSVPAKLVISGGPMLVVKVPASIPRGRCDIYVSNDGGKSDSVSVTIE